MYEILHSLLDLHNYSFSLYSIPVFTVGLYCLILGIYVLDVRQRNLFGLKFFACCIATVIWLFSMGLSYCSHNWDVAEIWAKIAMCGVAFIPFTQYSFNSEIIPHTKAGKVYNYLFFASLIFSVLFSVASLSSNLFISGIKVYFWGHYPIMGPVGYLFSGFFGILACTTLWALHSGYRASPSSGEKRRIRIMLFAVTFGYLAGTDFIAAFGFSSYPFGYVFITVMVSMWTHVAFKYNFLAFTPEVAATGTFAAMPGGLIVTDLDHRIQLVNQHACKLLGYNEPDLIVGKTLKETTRFPDEYFAVEELLNNPIRDDEFYLEDDEGKIVTLSVSIGVIKNNKGKPIGLSYVALDISQRKIAETQLFIAKQDVEGSRDKLQKTIDELSVILAKIVSEKGLEAETAMFVSNPTIPNCWEIKNCNSKLCPVYGKEGLRCWHVVGTHCKGTVKGTFAKKIDTCINCEVFIISTESQLFEIRETFNNMIQLLKNSHSELLSSQEAAVKANDAKSIFLANMSHEIRTPLNAIIGMTDLLAETELDSQQQQFFNTIQIEASALNKLINDILDISKIEAGKLEIESIPFNLLRMLDDFLESFNFRALQKNVEFTATLSSDLPKDILGDPGRLRQILVNLCGNALKFTPEGGRISLFGELIEDSEDKVKLKFQIEDTGVGIAEDAIKTIFKSFKQADESTTRKYGGTGLGTTISKQLATAMGGEIAVSSELGKGSNFWFTVVFEKQDELSERLPGNEVLNETLPTYGKEKELNGETPHILLVEDYPANQQVALAYLEFGGCKVDLAANGLEAVQKLKSLQTFDLVLMDVQMPVMDGYEATGEIRLMEKTLAEPDDESRIPIIALTANVSVSDREKCLSSGMDDFLTKPLHREELISMIQKWLPNYAPGEESSENDRGNEDNVEDVPIDFEKAIQEFGGQRDLLLRIIKEFLSDIDKQAALMETAIEDGEADTLRKEAHSIKGGSANVYANRLSCAAKSLEEMAKNGDLENSREALRILCSEANAVEVYLREYVGLS